jgi:hypothetical protein
MKKKVYKKPVIKRYINGTQVVGNVDPTTLYSANRDASIKDTGFNNSQQALLNQGNIRQQYQDRSNQAAGDFQAITTQNQANAATTKGLADTVTSVAGSIPIVGAAVQAGTAISGVANEAKLKQMQKTGNAEAGKGYATLANIASPSSSLLKGFEEGNATDIVNGLTGGVLTPFLKGGSDAQKFEEQQYQQGREDYANKQLKNYGAVDTSMQTAQLKKGRREIFLKNAKYKKASGVREIETEGREPIFSPKKKDGTRDLIYYNPNDPNHSEGGVKGIVTKNSNIKAKDAVVIPEGSAIVTAKDGMNKKALKAYKEGDRKKLEKVINKMPEDKNNKKQGGVDDLGYGFEDATGNRYSS